MKPSRPLAALMTIATQVVLALVAWNAWRLVDRDEVRVAGKALAVLAGVVCAFAALALFVPLAKTLRPAEKD